MQKSNMGIGRNTLIIAGALVIAVLIGLFAFGGGHNTGQPSAPGGPSNVMEKD